MNINVNITQKQCIYVFFLQSMSVLCYATSNSRTPSRYNFRVTVDNTLYVKGAPEGIVNRCSSVKLGNGKVVALTPALRNKCMQKIEEMSNKAYRCLAMAIKEDVGALTTYNGPEHSANKMLTEIENFAEIESDMTLVGFVGIEDPPRPMVRQSIEECRAAGIRVMMITGDAKNTAESIACQIGMFDENEDLTGKSFSGIEFMALTEAEQISFLMDGGGSRVFSRAEPAHKQMLVKLLKSQDEVVAMTGDGKNHCSSQAYIHLVPVELL